MPTVAGRYVELLVGKGHLFVWVTVFSKMMCYNYIPYTSANPITQLQLKCFITLYHNLKLFIIISCDGF